MYIRLEMGFRFLVFLMLKPQMRVLKSEEKTVVSGYRLIKVTKLSPIKGVWLPRATKTKT